MDRVPEFWEWLSFQGNEGSIKIPIEIYEEFSDTKDSDGNKDDLAVWSEQNSIRESLLLDEEADQKLVSRVTYEGYMETPTDDEILKVGRDPFLISYALRDISNRCIVTSEVSSPSKKRANRRIPDVCKTFNIKCINSFQMIRELDFSTAWR